MIQRQHPLIAGALAASLAAAACGAESGDNGAESPVAGLSTPTASAIDEGPVAERSAPGSAWYDYDATTHAVTPRDDVWLFESTDGAWLVAIDSYYDARGVSGTFSWRARAWSGDAWGDVHEGSPAGNVKDAPVCVRLDTRDVVSCDESVGHLWFGIEPRAVPAAGFAVRNPAVRPRGHHWDPDSVVRAHRLPGQDLAAIIDDPATLAASSSTPPNAAHDTSAGVLAETDLSADPGVDRYQLVTADMQLAWWRAWLDGEALHIESTCAPVALDPSDQPIAAAPTVTRAIPLGDRHGWLVDLCDDGDIGPWTDPDSIRTADPGAWDLVVERTGDTWTLRASPGALVVRAEQGTSDPTEAMQVDAAHAGFWE